MIILEKKTRKTRSRRGEQSAILLLRRSWGALRSPLRINASHRGQQQAFPSVRSVQDDPGLIKDHFSSIFWNIRDSVIFGSFSDVFGFACAFFIFFKIRSGSGDWVIFQKWKKFRTVEPTKIGSSFCFLELRSMSVVRGVSMQTRIWQIDRS